MIRFFQGIKRAADFFSIHPDGLSFVTERRLKDLEASVSRLPKAISDRNFTSIMNLEYDIYELKETIKTLQSTLDKEQVHTPIQSELPIKKGISLDAFREYWEKTYPGQKLVPSKPKSVKLQAVEEIVKKVKSTLTQREVKRLFTYRDGELYWKVDQGNKSKKGDKAHFYLNTVGYYYLYIPSKQKLYNVSRLIFLMFHGYLPERVCFVDNNPLNTRIENLKAATCSQVVCRTKKRTNNVSGYKGVSIQSKTGLYKAQIYKKGKSYYLGLFKTPEEAHKVYCKAAKKLHGEFARVA